MRAAVKLLDGLPLAVELAGILIHEGIGLGFLLTKNACAALLLSFRSVYGPWQVPISLLRNPELFETTSYLQEHNDPMRLKTFVQNEVMFNMAVDQLRRVFLAKRKQNSIRVLVLSHYMAQYVGGVLPQWAILGSNGSCKSPMDLHDISGIAMKIKLVTIASCLRNPSLLTMHPFKGDYNDKIP